MWLFEKRKYPSGPYWGMIWALIGIPLMLCFACTMEMQFIPYRIAAILTPTAVPHCQPQTGEGYIITEPFLTGPSFRIETYEHPGSIATRGSIRLGTRVTILESQGHSRSKPCYLYKIIPSSGIGEIWWIPQDELTVEKGLPVPLECVCDPESYPDHTPTTGWVYTYAPPGYGILLLPSQEMRQDELPKPMLRSGVTVEILQTYWSSEYTNYNTRCYRYRVREPQTGTTGWLPEEFITSDPTLPPTRTCLSTKDRDYFLQQLP